MSDPFTTTPQSMSRIGRLGTPFALFLVRFDTTADGHFRPGSLVIFTDTLRKSGILSDLAPEVLRDLMILLTYATPEGDCKAAAEDVALDTGLTVAEANSRLRRLAATKWRSARLAVRVRSALGVETYRPHPAVLGLLGEMAAKEEDKGLGYRPAGRAAVIAHSRARYARPREEVERLIARLNGWPEPQGEEVTSGQVPGGHADSPEQDALRRLGKFGVPDRRAEELVRRYGVERCLRQVEWIRYRKARRPIAMLVASIERNFGVPDALRRKDQKALAPDDGAPIPPA